MNKKLIIGLVITIIIIIMVIVIFNNNNNNNNSEEQVQGAIIKNPNNAHKVNISEEEYNLMLKQQECEANCETIECIKACY